MNKLYRLVAFLGCLFLGVGSYIRAVEMSPARTLTLSNEALAGARYNKVIILSQNFLDNNINSNVCTSEILVNHLFNLREAYTKLGKEKEYEKYTHDLFKRIDSSRGSTLLRYFFLVTLDCKGDFEATADNRYKFSHFGDNTPGLTFFEENIGLLPKDMVDKKPLVRAWLSVVKADLLAYAEDFEGAQSELDKVTDILTSNFAEGSPELLIGDFATEILLAQKGNWDEAIKKALENKKQIEKYGKNIKEYYAVVARLLQYFINSGQFQEASEISKEAMVRPSVFEAAPYLIDYRSIQGPVTDNSPSAIFAGMDYDLTCLNSAIALFSQGQQDNATKSAVRVLYGLQNDIAKSYPAFAFNRASSKDKRKVDLLVQAAPMMAIKNLSDSMLQGLAYDAALIYKQLSLSAGTLYRNLAAKLGNEAISKRYSELEQSRKLLDEASAEQMDSLIQRISQLESYLQRNLSSRSNISLGEMPKWKDIRSSLDEDEAAVEFSIAVLPEGDRYIASIIKADYSFPQTIQLSKVEEIDKIKDFCKTSEVYGLLWEPVIKKLKGVKRLYFSPVGKLNLLPLEYVPDSSDEMMNEKFSMYRLSSTRELMYRKDEQIPSEILLYGGIKYDLDQSELSNNKALADKSSERYYSDSFDVEEVANEGLRAGIAFLPATIDEINQINSIFSENGRSSVMIEGSTATETSIKELDGKAIPIIHIATHGFTVSEKSRTRLGRFLSRSDEKTTFEEKSLGRSGLMFAGAANTLASKSTNSASGFDDGILTGREISRIDLSRIGTMVLSACESGLGELSSEGVVGLQRGLKRAGVHTLVMSLWKVDDEGTALLMTEFYKNLLKGNNAATAMKEAQKFLRSYDNGRFDDPRFWAAFIILDSI